MRGGQQSMRPRLSVTRSFVPRVRVIQVLAVLLPLLFVVASCMVPGLKTSAAGRLAAVSEADSLQIHEAAKADQKAFEILRRSRMPILNAGTTYPRCGEVIGRYCMEVPIGAIARMGDFTENPDVTVARVLLTGGLEAAARRLPGDRWIQGQRVRYLVEGGDTDGAVVSATECEVEPLWWCTALLGYALHHGRRPAEAEAVFRVTLSAMDPGERAAWLSPLLALDDESRVRFGALSEAEQTMAGAHFWMLADPLWTREGNEVFSEHLSRWVGTDLQMGTEPIEGSPWGVDLIEVMVRYGTSPQWIRAHGAIARDTEVNTNLADRWSYLSGGIEPIESVFVDGSGGLLDELSDELSEEVLANVSSMIDPRRLWAPPRGIRDLIMRVTPPRQSLLPPREVLFAGTMTAGQWDVEEDFPSTGYSISMGETTAMWFAPLAHQMAVFPRGDSVVVVASYDLPAHGVDASIRVDAGFALLPADNNTLGNLRVLRADGSTGTGVFAMTAEAVPSFLSLELVIPEEGALARARYGVDLSPRPMGIPTLSDLLLLLDGTLPESLPDAVSAARPSNRVLPGEPLGIYWELHGLDLFGLTEVPVSLAFHAPPAGGIVGAIRWLGERIGLLDEVQPIRITFMVEVGEGSFMGQSLGFRFPEVDEGRYLVELQVELPGREPLTALQEVEVTRSTLPPPRNAIIHRRPLLTRIVGNCGDFESPLRCWSRLEDPSIFGHYGGVRHLSNYGYDGW